MSSEASLAWLHPRSSEDPSRFVLRCLEAVAASPLRDELVLVGSRAIEEWFPGRARRAHRLDLVVRDSRLSHDSSGAEALLGELASSLRRSLAAADVRVGTTWAGCAACDGPEEGTTRPVSWFAEPFGESSLAVVFESPLAAVPTLERLGGPAANGPELWLVSPAECLARKVVRLEIGGTHPKHVFDALLLTERTAVSLDLLERVHAVVAGGPWPHGADTGFVQEIYVDWAAFALEYPWAPPEDRSVWLRWLAERLRVLPARD